MKTSVEKILDEIKSLQKEIKKMRTPEDDDLFTLTQVREKWGAHYSFIMGLIENGYLIPFKLELPGDGRKKGGLRFKRSEINEALEHFRMVTPPQELSKKQKEIKTVEEIAEEIFGYKTKRRK